MLATIMRRGRTWPWIRMRPFLAQFSEPVWSGHLPSWADFITTTPVFRFSVHTGGVLREQHCGVIAAIPELGESSRCEKRVISGFSTVSLPRDEGSLKQTRCRFCVPNSNQLITKRYTATAAKSRHRVERSATAFLLHGRDTQPANNVTAWCKEKVRDRTALLTDFAPGEVRLSVPPTRRSVL
jgi:hypothetical protein